ncbi:low affinity immunoglobulin gamma Fc region receptor III-A-like isoform X2 [Anguilla rostrata]|uniref:low affinity immunoglobulin gamma Fc region receptor III-A-like isoform X2 n=1 Tax=Anguilla rostrata TaxID=7938 RepID=UPI0030D141DF
MCLITVDVTLLFLPRPVLSLLIRLGHPRPVLTLHPNSPLIFTGETVRLRCFGQKGIRSGFTWYKTKPHNWTQVYKTPKWTDDTYTISSVTEAHNGSYKCTDYYLYSDDVTLSVSDKPRPVLTISPLKQIYAGETVRLFCEVTVTSAGWEYYWYKTIQKGTGSYDIALIASTAKSLHTAALAHTAEYFCRAGRGNPVWYTEYSYPVHIQVSALPKATLTIEPKLRPLYTGETVTLKCVVDSYSNWTYFWYKEQPQTAISFTKEYNVTISGAAGSEQGQYWCEGRLEGRNVTSQRSDSITLTAVSGKLVFGLGSAPLLLASIILCVKWCRRSGSSNEAAVKYTEENVEPAM